MTEIVAKQLIYTRVESAYSPAKKSGYQVYYASRALEQVDIDFIVKKINDFQPNATDLVRLQCFFLSKNNSVVIARTSIIDSDPEIVDKDKRPYILIAHCFVLSKDDYELIGCDPFVIIENFQFTQSAAELVKAYNHDEQKEIPAIFSTPQNRLIENNSWFKQILLLVYVSSPKFVNDKKTLLIYGNPTEIYEAIKTIFGYIPRVYRRNLTFDTYIRGRQIPLGEYWAIGLHEWKTGYSTALNASTKTFNSEPDKYDDLYSTWLQKAIDRGNFNTDEILDIQTVVDLFSQKQGVDEKVIDKAALLSFYEIHRSFFEPKFLSLLTKEISGDIASKLSQYLLINLSVFEIVSIVARESISAQELSSYMRKWLVDISSLVGQLEGKDWSVIEKISINTNDPVLQIWSALFSKNKKLFSSASNKLTANEYVYCLQLLQRPFSASSLFLPKFATLFTHVLSEKLNLLTGKEFVDIVELLLDANANRDLDDLSGFVHELDNKELTRLEKAISGRLTPKGFQSAIKSHRTKLGSPYTFFDSILGRN